MKRSRIVIMMVEPPLPFGNAAARWYYVLLRGLVERGHEVVAFATSSKAHEIEQAAKLFPRERYDLRCYMNPVRRGLRAKFDTLANPFSYMFSPELKRDMTNELDRGFDVLHLEQLWAGWTGLEYSSRALVNVHHLVSIDMSESPARSANERMQSGMVSRAERRLLRAYTHFRACSPRLVEPIRKMNSRAKMTVVPIGLDTSLYQYFCDDERPAAPVVTLIGSMNWLPGISSGRRMLGRLYPEIKRRVPNARFRVVGWAARSALAEYLSLPDVEIIENVPDTNPYFRDAGVFLYAPSRGSGMKIKVLEAMALGAPVVTTSEGVEGLPACDCVHAGIADDDAGLVDRTVALLGDRERQNCQRRAARELIESHCAPARTVAMIEEIYAGMERTCA
jgi:polysaccharide biosynthesis protein PslH